MWDKRNCPVCGAEIRLVLIDNCPNCGFDLSTAGNLDQLNKKREVYTKNLPKKTKKEPRSFSLFLSLETKQLLVSLSFMLLHLNILGVSNFYYLEPIFRWITAYESQFLFKFIYYSMIIITGVLLRLWGKTDWCIPLILGLCQGYLQWMGKLDRWDYFTQIVLLLVSWWAAGEIFDWFFQERNQECSDGVGPFRGVSLVPYTLSMFIFGFTAFFDYRWEYVWSLSKIPRVFYHAWRFPFRGGDYMDKYWYFFFPLAVSGIVFFFSRIVLNFLSRQARKLLVSFEKIREKTKKFDVTN